MNNTEKAIRLFPETNNKEHKEKKHHIVFTRVISVMLVIIMALTMIPFGVIPVNAARTRNKAKTRIYRLKTEVNYSTVVNNTYNQVQGKTKLEAFKAKIGKIDSILGYVGSALNLGLQIHSQLKDPNNDKEWTEVVAQTAIVAVLSHFGISIPGIDSTEDKVETMLTEINDRLEDLDDRISDLSEQIDSDTIALMQYIASVIEEQDCKNALNEFTQTNNPQGFSYYSWRSDLAQKYNELVRIIDSGYADENSIKIAYDNLYGVAVKAELLYNYMTGKHRELTDGMSIQEILYSYYIEKAYNDGIVSADIVCPELTCVEFVEDMYEQYSFAQLCLAMCNNYQLQYMIDHFENNEALLSKYYFVDSSVNLGTNHNILVSSMIDCIPKINDDQETITSEIAEYLAYILNYDSSYTYVTAPVNGKPYLFDVSYEEVFDSERFNTVNQTVTYGSMVNDYVHVRTNNIVNSGSTLWMNTNPEDLFPVLNYHLLRFESSDNSLATVTDGGIVSVVGDSGSFDISYYYGDTVLYTMSFVISSNLYSGGMGTEQAPYLISNYHDLQMISQHPDAYFLLTNDIDVANDSTFPGGEFKSIPKLDGTLDGQGYSIFNYMMSSGTSSKTYLGLIEQNNGTIKNLTIGCKDCEKYSVEYRVTHSAADSLDCYLGALSGINYGTIQNCSLVNTLVDLVVNDVDDGRDATAFLGGLVSANAGIIDYCRAEDCYVICTVNHVYDSGENNNGFSGGLVSVNMYNKGIVSNSWTKNSVIKSDVHEHGHYAWAFTEWAKAKSIAGGIVGYNDKGSRLYNCCSDSNEVTSYVLHEGGYKVVGYGESYSGGISGFDDIGMDNCVSIRNVVNACRNKDGHYDVNYDGRIVGLAGETSVLRNTYCEGNSGYSYQSTTWVKKHSNLALNNSDFYDAISGDGMLDHWDFSNEGVPSVALAEIEEIVVTIPVAQYYATDHLIPIGISIEGKYTRDLSYTSGINYYKQFDVGAYSDLTPEFDCVDITTYAGEHVYADIDVSDHVYGEWSVTVIPTVESEGVRVCNCLGKHHEDSIVEIIPALVREIYGDADGDNEISIIDVTIIQRYLAKYTVADPERVERCGDVSGDGLDIVDVTLIQRYLAQYTVPFPVGEVII